MPLIQGKSKKAFKENVSTEMDAGKPQKQSLAIAFSVQRKNKKKKMALGGAVETPVHSKDYDRNPGTPAKKADDRREAESEYMSKDWSEGSAPARKPDDERLPKDEYMAGHFAKGGPVNPKLQQAHAAHRPMHPMDLMDDDERASSIADAIMEKRHRMAEGGIAGETLGTKIGYPGSPKPKAYADGGMVDLERNSEEEGSTPYDTMNAEAGMKEQYDDSQLSPDPMDSNETGDSREDESENEHDMISKIRSKMRAKRG